MIHFMKKSLGRKTLTKGSFGDIYTTMAFEKVLRELVKKKGLRKVAQDLGINHGSLYRSIMDGSNVGLDRIEAILSLFGYELKLSRRKEARPIKSKPSRSKRRKEDL
jgi:DNA-binding phage protein